MRGGAHTTLASAARFYTPLIVLFALTLLVTRPPGSGVGLLAGLVLVMALIAHALVFGAEAARAASPALLTRLVAACGLVAVVIGSMMQVLFARELVEAGLFLVMAAGGALIVTVLFGRAPTMRDQAP